MRDLWVSRRNGYRRRGTSVLELCELFRSGITASSINEPLQSCFSEDDAISILNKMQQLGFDTIGIKKSEDEPVIGYINSSELTNGKCERFTHKFQLSDLISNSTPLIEVLPNLRKKQRVFVLSGNSVDSIVTRADLQKPPVRIMLFGLITLLEMHLTHHIRKFHPNEKWRSKLDPDRIKKAEDLMNMRIERNEKLDLTDCLQFCDKRELVLASDKILKVFGFESRRVCLKILKDIEKLRDKLAHSQDIVSGTTWEDIIDLSDNIEKRIQSSEEHIK